MKGIHLTITALLTAIVIGLAILIPRLGKETSPSGEKSIGQNLFPSLGPEEVSAISFRSQKEVNLDKSSGEWKVASLFNYPADYKKINTFISTVAELKGLQNIKAGKSQFARLGLDVGQENGEGTEINLLDASGKKLVTFIAGKEHSTKSPEDEALGEMGMANGRFVLIPEDGKVVVVDNTLGEASFSPTEWTDRDFISAKDLKTASLAEDGQVKWKLSRNDEKGKMAFENKPEGREEDSDKINSVSNCLSWIRFADIGNPSLAESETGLDKPAIFNAETFSGKNYEVSIGKQNGSNRYVKVKISFEAPPPPQDDEKAAQATDEEQKKKLDEEKKKKEQEYSEKVKKNREEAEEDQKKYGSWTYLIAETNIKPMLTAPEEFLKKVEEKKDGDDPTKKDTTGKANKKLETPIKTP